MTQVVLAESAWPVVHATPRRSKARADAIAGLLPDGGHLELWEGTSLLRTIDVAAWSVGPVQADGKYPLIPGAFTDPGTGAGNPDWAVFTDDDEEEVLRVPIGVGPGKLQLPGGALVESEQINRGVFVLLYQTDDLPPPDPEPPPPDPEPPVGNWIDVVVSDMELFHDAPARTLQYIPGWGSGWEEPTWTPKPAGWLSVLTWGVIMADYNAGNSPNGDWRVPGPYTGNQAPNTRAQVRDIQIWWLLSNGQWVLGRHNVTPGGYMYLTSWAGEATSSENAFRDETGNGGGRSARYINMNGPFPPAHQFDAYHWHFWSSRTDVPANIVGFCSAYFARKILDNPSGADDRANARLLAQCAGDWWRSSTALYAGYHVNNWETGFNRFKYLSNDWQLIAHHSLTSAQIRANPPPLIGL